MTQSRRGASGGGRPGNGSRQSPPPRRRPAGTATQSTGRPQAQPQRTRPASGQQTKAKRAGGAPPRAARAASTPPPRRKRPVSLGVGHPRRRARFLMVAVCCVFSLFAVQLLRIQGFESSGVSAAALGSRIQKVTIPAQRGEIVDANGVVLADSVDRRNVTGDPFAMDTYRKKINGERRIVGLSGAAADLAPLLGVKSSDLLSVLTRAKDKKQRFSYLAKDISPTQWRSIQSLRIPGVFSERTVRREYPQGTSVAPLVGWVNNDGRAGGGVEQMLNPQLNGKPGVHIYERAPDGRPIATGDSKDTPAAPGQSVKLTINNDLQWYAQNVLAQRVTESGALSGDVVVLDVRSGKLLAAASYPSFDPNNMGSAKGYLQSRPFTEVFEPGSTSKVITMAAALEEKVVTPTSPVTVPNRLTRAGRPFKDSEEHGTLNLTTAGVLAKSSNIGTVLIGEKMTPGTVHNYMTKFGLGSRSGIGFPGESRGIVAPAAQWKGDQRYTVLFGQGVSGTAIQQASVFQTVANGGVRKPVSLVEGVSDGHGGWTPPQDDRTDSRVISQGTATTLTAMMRSVVSEGGTAEQAAVPGYEVAGKTSTAQRYDSALKKYSGTTASFIGFAPAAKPEIVVAVTIQRPTRGTYGGSVAGPAFSKIMSFALQQRQVPPVGGGPTPYPLTTGTTSAPATREKP